AFKHNSDPGNRKITSDSEFINFPPRLTLRKGRIVSVWALMARVLFNSRLTASALNISHSSILRVLTENQMHPYKLVPSNELEEDDFDRRILFCDQMMQMIDDNILQIENVLFLDESTFTLHGHVNRQNCHYWSRGNPQWMRELHTQNP
ncbi:hypothetical protein NQ318_005260, partial [Aromia moschata]